MATALTNLRLSYSEFKSRLERKIVWRFGDWELHHLRKLQRVYNKRRAPELLIIAHSQMFYRGVGEEDCRPVVEMIREQLGGKVRIHSIGGPGYNQRMALAYLSALKSTRSRPKAVIVAIHPVLAGNSWYSSPRLGWEKVSDGILAAIEAGPKGGPKRLPRPDEADWEAYDRQPAASLIGSQRTLGELTLVVNSHPATKVQHEVRALWRMDFYYADTLAADSPGVSKTAELAEMLRDMEVPAIAYLGAINYQAAQKLVGESVKDHIAANAEVVVQAYRQAIKDDGEIIDFCFDCEDSEFSDPLHHKQHARLRLAKRLAESVRPYVDR